MLYHINIEKIRTFSLPSTPEIHHKERNQTENNREQHVILEQKQSHKKQ